MKRLENLADVSTMKAHHYDALGHLLETAEYYRRQKTRGVGKEERHETLRHLTTVAKTTLEIEGDRTSQTVGERVREAVFLVR